MPIVIKESDWRETENTLVIRIPLRGVHSSKADIFHSERYLKASFEQYFYEVLLLHPVDIKKSKCTLTPTHIVFELVKCEPLLWNKLEPEITKAEKQELKKLCIDEEHKRIQKECAEKASKRSELKRTAVSEQIALDTRQRKTLEDIKTEEKNNALKEMEIWKSGKQKTTNRSKVCQKKEINTVAPPPPPRTSRTIKVEFTPREFPTPCRESRLEEEDEWLRKQAEARRSVGFISEDLRPEEHNPQFLKCKGDGFLRSRNYLAAISAYTFGIKLNDKFVDLFVARAEAHLALGNYKRTVDDCSTALELMKPEVPSNLQERALCIGRRGIGLIKLGLVKQGIDELKASLSLVPNEDFSAQLDEAIDSFNDENTAE